MLVVVLTFAASLAVTIAPRTPPRRDHDREAHMRDCAIRELERDPTARGKVVLAVTVDASGTRTFELDVAVTH